MRRWTLFSACLLLTSTLGAQERPLTNDDIIEMLKAGVPETSIIEKIESSGCDCDTGSAFAVMILNGAGASPDLIRAMRGASRNPKPAAPVSRPTATEQNRVTVFGGYSYQRGDLDVNWHGFNAAVTYHLNRWLGVTGDISGHYPDVQGSFDLSFYNFAAGPEFSVRGRRARGFVRVLAGGARFESDVLGGGGGSETFFSTLVGGGVDVDVSSRFGVRVVQADWLRVWDSPSAYLDQGRLSAGIIVKF